MLATHVRRTHEVWADEYRAYFGAERQAGPRRDRYQCQAPRRRRRRYRVLAYDSVNHGLSSNSPRGEQEPDRADELEGFLSATVSEPPILAGQSMGGMTIIRWAIGHPDAARALVISGMGIFTEPRRGPSPLQQPIGDDVIFLGVAGSFTPEFYASSRLLVDRYIRVRSTAVRLEAHRHPREDTHVKPAWDPDVLAQGVTAIRSPMLIDVGALDNLRPAAERLHELVPHSRLCLIQGAAHSAHYEKFEE
jgi:pimeloyl-ACP methyl ester carboxylesterase